MLKYLFISLVILLYGCNNPNSNNNTKNANKAAEFVTKIQKILPLNHPDGTVLKSVSSHENIITMEFYNAPDWYPNVSEANAMRINAYNICNGPPFKKLIEEGVNFEVKMESKTKRKLPVFIVDKCFF